MHIELRVLDGRQALDDLLTRLNAESGVQFEHAEHTVKGICVEFSLLLWSKCCTQLVPHILNQPLETW